MTEERKPSMQPDPSYLPRRTPTSEAVTPEPYRTDRERLEAAATPEVLELATAFQGRLIELGHHDYAMRRALLLDLATLAQSSAPKASPAPLEGLVEALARTMCTGEVERHYGIRDGVHREVWADQTEYHRSLWLARAKDAIEALSRAQLTQAQDQAKT